jgi:hypothetical protein
MKNRNVLVGGSFILVAVAVVAIWTGFGGGDETPGRPEGLVGEAVTQPAPSSQPAMVTHIDPVTGEPTSPPAGGEGAQLGDVIDTSDEGLVEKPSPVEGGGMMIELDGRFQNTVVVDGDSVECVPDSQAAAEAAAAAGGEK